MAPRETLQGLLEEKAHSVRVGRLLCYPLGNTCGPVEITYTQLYQKANDLGRMVRSLKQFRGGSPVLLHFDDHWDTILWFWSVLFAGGLPVLSSPFGNNDEDRKKHTRHLSHLLQSPLCLTRDRSLPLFGDGHGIYLYSIESLLGETRSMKAAGPVEVEHSEDDRAQLAQNGTHVQNGENNTTCTDDEHLAVLMLTSGSTGNAKAVSLSHKQLLTSIAGKVEMRKLPQDRPLLNWIGLDHVAGLVEIHLQALWLGVDQVHASAADIVPSPLTFLDLLSRHHASRSFAPNFFLVRLVSALGSPSETEGRPAWDLSDLVSIISGGESNDMKTCLAASALLSKYGAPRNVITPGFGMTETCAGSIYNTNLPDYDVSRGYVVASVGKCIRGAEMRITITDDSRCVTVAAPDEPGDLEVRGPVVFKKYYRNPVATREAFTRDHWFRTGDRAVIDSNGHLSLVGRAKEVININGVKHIAADVETTIAEALGDRVARLVVFPSLASYTERVTIAYIPNSFPGRDDEMADIAHLATQACLLQTATRPLVFALQEASTPLLLISTLGKISRLKAARLFEDGIFATDLQLHEQAILRVSKAARKVKGNGSGHRSEAEARLLANVAQVLDLNPEHLDVDVEASLFDMGFTSMHVIKLKSVLEKRLAIEVTVIQIMKNSTIRALASVLDDMQTQQLRRQQQHLKDGSSSNGEGASIHGYDPVVVFRARGSKTPLWLMHPGVGEVLVFLGLAQCLAADDRPVFALRAAGFEPDHPCFDSIKQAVDTYTRAIRQRQPRGPYALAGYSYGSMLAFEAAKRLIADGEEVRFLGCFNLPPHIKKRIRVLDWNMCLLNLSHFLGLVAEDVSETLEGNPSFGAATKDEALGWILRIADRPRWEELGLDIDALVRWVDVAFGLQRMARDYDPSGQVENIDVFHARPLKTVASSREVWLSEHLGRWADFSREAPRFHAVQGAHYTMIGPDHVAGFAQTLVGALGERGV